MIPGGVKSMFGRGPDGPAAPTPKVEIKAPDAAPPNVETPSDKPAAPPEPELKAAKLVEAPKPAPAQSGLPPWLAGAAMQIRNRPAVPAAAAAAVLALGIGYGIGSGSPGRDGAAETARWQEAMGELRQSREETARLAHDLKSLRTASDAAKADRDRLRGELLAKQAALGDKLERAAQEGSARGAKLAEQVERLGRDLSKPKDEKVAAAAAAPIPSPPPKPAAIAAAAPEVTQTGSLAEKREVDPRKTRLEGFFVRDYDDGFALVELRNGGYMDAAIGYAIPGAGKVEAIERRGRQWVVVTSKGYIAER